MRGHHDMGGEPAGPVENTKHDYAPWEKRVDALMVLLSDREREIFQLIAEGKANKEIATLLSISPSTVETHRARIMEKLDLHSAAEIVLYAVRRGVIR